MKGFLRLLGAVAIFAVPALSFAQSWSIDPEHSSVGFKVRHLMVSNVKGDFRKFSGMVEIDEKNIANSRVNVTIDTASIDTGHVRRDEHLRSPDFLDVAQYPTMTFVSQKVQKSGAGTLKVHGLLTLHGVTRPVVLVVEGPTKGFKDPWGNVKRGASAVAKINRKDFGLVWNKMIEGGGVAVGDEVAIALEVELLKK